jgi:hypothetical protein
MKKLITLIAIAFFSETMIAQAGPSSPTVPPQAVLTAFTSRFPNVQVKKWAEQQDTYYALFRLKGKKTFAYYNADGSWKATEIPMKWSWNLPEKVKQAWRHSDFAAWYLMDIKRIETPDQILYALHVNSSPLLDADHNQIDREEVEIFFNEKGELVRKDNK